MENVCLTDRQRRSWKSSNRFDQSLEEEEKIGKEGMRREAGQVQNSQKKRIQMIWSLSDLYEVLLVSHRSNFSSFGDGFQLNVYK